MAQIRLGLGQVNITDYLIVVARKTTTPLVEEAREPYAPPQPTTRNVVVPATGDIDPVIYYVDIHESSDGSTLGLLLIQIVYDLKNNIILSEKRYYRADGGGPNDPLSGQNIIEDSYLDGKTISAVYKEGFRPLVPPEYASFKEYDLHTGGGIELLNDMVFGPGEVTVIEISYATAAPATTSGSGFYSGVITLIADTTLNNTHRGKRLKCESDASSRQVHTLEDVTTVPDGTFYYFTFNGGNQLQTKIVPVSGQTIEYNGASYTEMTLGLGEYLRIERAGAGWEATLVHENILRVGEKLTAGYLSHPSTMPEDGRLLDGDDYPRIWYWIKNILPSTHKIIDDTVVNGGYSHPDGKQGLFVLHSTLKKFRMPNTQGISEKGLADFDSYGADTGRIYDYPGGVQAQQIPNHKHYTVAIEQLNSFLDPTSTQQIAYQRNDSGDYKYKLGPSSNAATVGLSSDSINGGSENRVRNVGVIFLRRI